MIAGMVPLYVYTLGQVFINGAGLVIESMYYLLLWLLILLIPFIIGMAVRRRQQTISDALLNWLIKPILLLAFILFITLGLYINMYVLTVLDNAALVTGGLIPFIGFGIGGGIMLLLKQGKQAAKTLAIEAAIMNSIVVIVSLRFTLPQPDADLASASAMWVLFLTPAPFVLMFLFHRIKKKIMFNFNKKDIENEKNVTLKNSFAAITKNALQIGGLESNNHEAEPSQSPTTTTYGHDGDQRRLLTSTSQTSSEQPHTVINNVSFMDMADGEDADMEPCIHKPMPGSDRR